MKEISSEEKLIRDSLNSPLIQALDDEGITLPKLAKQLRKELKAKETKCFNDKGQVIYSSPLDAWDVQQRARIDAHKLRGDYPAEEHRITSEMITSRSPEEVQELQKIADRVIEEIRGVKNKDK